MVVSAGEVTRGVSPLLIGASGGGSRLAQITVVGLDFAGRRSALERILPLSSGFRGKSRERKTREMYHNLRVICFHRLGKISMRSLSNSSKDRRVSCILNGDCKRKARVAEVRRVRWEAKWGFTKAARGADNNALTGVVHIYLEA